MARTSSTGAPAGRERSASSASTHQTRSETLALAAHRCVDVCRSYAAMGRALSHTHVSDWMKKSRGKTKVRAATYPASWPWRDWSASAQGERRQHPSSASCERGRNPGDALSRAEAARAHVPRCSRRPSGCESALARACAHCQPQLGGICGRTHTKRATLRAWRALVLLRTPSRPLGTTYGAAMTWHAPLVVARHSRRVSRHPPS